MKLLCTIKNEWYMQIASGSVFIKRYMCNQFNINEPIIIIGFGKN